MGIAMIGTQKIADTADCAHIRARRDFSVDLSAQIHFDGRIDRNEAIDLAE
jgi:hypothetical protein